MENAKILGKQGSHSIANGRTGKGNEPILPEIGADYVRALRQRLRDEQGLSVARFALELGAHTRSYIKHVEGGSLPVSGKLAREITELEKKMFPRRKRRKKNWRTMLVFFL